ncbi:MAG: hypothetical protein HXX10_07770 [Rhodoplanes sp.]|uniref:hypothetical protein n=1 Tax=Rhodoplanes sp. TaxID=1968906 RepID=UPI0017AAFFD3|nr:hypothetical protein [Rhodoplanes sp.]NVO13919.1 hypothetical protein [Rhodoplanes sp.]
MISIATLQAAWALITSPIGRVVGVVGLIGLALLWADHRGADRVRTEWAAANAIAATKAAEADAVAATHADAVDKRSTAAADAADQANREARDAYVKDLEKRIAAGCAADGDDARRLRDIR